MRAGRGTGWKWVQQYSFLLYDDSFVVQSEAPHTLLSPYVRRGRPPANFEIEWSLTPQPCHEFRRISKWGFIVALTRALGKIRDTEKGGGPTVSSSISRTPEVVGR